MSKKIIDVSVYNGKIDWKLAKSKGVQGAIIKIVNKSMAKDIQFENNYKGCTNQKIPWGVYNYTYATTAAKAKSDMKLICDILDKLDKTYFTLGVWFDIEDSCQAKLSKTAIAEIVNAAQKTVEDRGYNFGVYTGMAYYKEHIDSSKVNCKNWWIARYYKGYDIMQLSTTPNAKYKPTVVDNLMAWQYTSSGKIASGVSTGNGGKFDLNILYREFFSNENPPYTKIKKTSGKSKIKWMQKKLNQCYTGKLPDLAVDGIWGTKTEAMLKAYWKQLGWKTTGTYCGKKTCTALWKGRKK